MCGQVFWHPEKHLESTIHGDDLLTVGDEKNLAWFDRVVGKHFLVKEATVLGTGPGQLLSTSFLNRTIDLCEPAPLTRPKAYLSSINFMPHIQHRSVQDIIQ